MKHSEISLADIGKECRRTADALGDLLSSWELPEDYKVAVVGRFKTGKSSFVNELLGARLASEDTNPETAAITSFRYGQEVKATVKFLPKEEWYEIKSLYTSDPKHIDAHRVKIWNTFSKPKKNKDGGQDEVFDLKALENDFVKSGGHQLEIAMVADGTKKSVTEFRRKLKEFTSGARPLHCLVESIEITSPASILNEGILLVDTPGLDDTERFRVSLTEKIVDKVDAVLFLTKSGVAYSQSEKNFLLSLLRKGTVKQLLIVITQVDQTYDQHVRAAEDNDEDPEPIKERIAQERTRIEKEINATLNDLGLDESLAIQRYREQLGNVEIAFTSAALHRDFQSKKNVPYAIEPTDPGGVDHLKSRLLLLLSTESRLALAAQNIANGTQQYINDLLAVLSARLHAILDKKDKEEAEQKLRDFRDEFTEASTRFEEVVKQQVALLEKRLSERQRQHRNLIENVALLAREQLNDLEVNDVGRHWRTRRSGYWGYMSGLQMRVANRIFPKVQEMLSEYTSLFSSFANEFEILLNILSTEGARISDKLELGSTTPFDVTSKLKESLERSMRSAQELITTEEIRVTTLLDDFVDDEVSDRISERRTNVSDIWGTGTTNRQSLEVRDFYREVKDLLAEALSNHLRDRGFEFCAFLVAEAKAAPRDALSDVHLLLDQAMDTIRATALAVVAGQKETVQSFVAEIEADCAEPLRLANDLKKAATVLSYEGNSIDAGSGHSFENTMRMDLSGNSNPEDIADQSLSETAETLDTIDSSLKNDDWVRIIQQKATVVLGRIRLHDGSTGWSYSKLFDARLLKGAQHVTLIDPYLASHHQIRNLNEFLLHVAEVAHPKTIDIITRFESVEATETQDRAINTVAKDLFQLYGISLGLHRHGNLHDRYLVLDHGVLFKLGRGLDIYKPATGLAAHRPANRRVRETEIDVFTVPEHELAMHV
jgi:signal recognition particle receptor subunit beta